MATNRLYNWRAGREERPANPEVKLKGKAGRPRTVSQRRLGYTAAQLRGLAAILAQAEPGLRGQFNTDCRCWQTKLAEDITALEAKPVRPSGGRPPMRYSVEWPNRPTAEYTGAQATADAVRRQMLGLTALLGRFSFLFGLARIMQRERTVSAYAWQAAPCNFLTPA